MVDEQPTVNRPIEVKFPAPRHWVELKIEGLPAYVTNSDLKPVCVADSCGQPADGVLVLAITMSRDTYHLPVCMRHASGASAAKAHVG